jgi:MFS family permease
MHQAADDRPLRIRDHPGFIAVWAGQSLSVIGIQATMFALSIWIFQETESVTKFGLVVAAQLVPSILLSTPAGLLVDRFSRRAVMIGCKIGSAAVALTAYLLFAQGLLSPLLAALITAATAIFGLVHQIAYSASVPLLVPKPLLMRANGLVQTTINIGAILVPLIAVGMLESVGLAPILLLEFGCFVLAALSLLLVRFKPTGGSRPNHGGTGMFSALTFGLRYLAGRRDLAVLLVFLSLAAFLNGFVYVLFRPYVLTITDTSLLGVIVTIAGVGGFAGAAFVSFLSKFRDRIAPLIWFSLVSGASMILCGITSSLYLIGLAAFIFSFAIPIVVVTAQTLWQQDVPIEAQGRVFAMRSLFASVAMLLAVLTSPLLAEQLAEPMLAPQGVLASTVGQLIGTGSGRGMGLLFILAGAAMVGVTLRAGRSRELERLRPLSSPAESSEPLKSETVPVAEPSA